MPARYAVVEDSCVASTSAHAAQHSTDQDPPPWQSRLPALATGFEQVLLDGYSFAERRLPRPRVSHCYVEIVPDIPLQKEQWIEKPAEPGVG